jgi:hypothetical protein
MPVTITGSNTPTAGGVVYGDGTTYATTSAGTSGRPIVSGGSGAPTFRPYTLPAADGSANQILKTDGAGALSFATPSTGALVFLSTVTASSSATVDVETTFNSTYRAYLIIGTGVFCDAAATLICRLKIGGTYITTTNYGYHRQNLRADNAAYSASADSGADEIPLSGTMSTSRSADFVMTVYFPSDTVSEKLIDWKLAPGRLNNNISTGALGYASNSTTTALTGVRFYFNTGTVASGEFRLYGIANS